MWLRTPAAMLEYWNLPEATAKTLVDGWVVTGDAGVLDEDGYLFIRDRIKDMIIVAGENVYPAEVENVIGKHPKVAESAVVGVPDERWGEIVHAFVVPVEGEHAVREGDRAVPQGQARHVQAAAALRVRRQGAAQPQREDPAQATA